MTQLELDMKNLPEIWDEALFKFGYRIPDLIKQYDKEADFGAIMVQHAIATGMFNEDDKWPSAFGKHFGTTREHSIQNFSGLILILDTITRFGNITSRELSDELGITKAAATNRLRFRATAGYIEHDGWIQVKNGRSKVFVITQKGKDLLKEVGE